MLMINICDKVLNKICSVCWGYRIQCTALLCSYSLMLVKDISAKSCYLSHTQRDKS